MKTNVFLNIAVRIIILFSIGIIMSYVPDNLRSFFGDTKYIFDGNLNWRGGDGSIDTEWIWGSRHYWYFWMCVSLFILSLINFIVSVRNLVLKEYPNQF